MKRLLALLLCLQFVFVAPVFAEKTTVEQLEDAGIVVAMDPPQASAEALLKLPTVYSLPGSFSYWVKHLIEEIQLIFTSDPEDRTALLLSFSQARLSEGYEAVKSGKADAALKSLQEYQADQHELATSLNTLQNEDANIKPYLERLNTQLGLQKALQEYVEEEIVDPKKRDEISNLLDVSAVQRLAWSQYTQTVLLGEQDVRKAPIDPQATQSASPSAELK